jgi:hypothetical protein
MIGSVVWRGVVVVASFFVAVGVALAALFALGSVWMGDELHTIAMEDPQFRAFVLDAPVLRDPAVQRRVAAMFGAVVFLGTVGPALTALPAFAAAVAGEVLHIRSWMYYVLAGAAALAILPLLLSTEPYGTDLDVPSLSEGQSVTIFATAGFAGGFIYWLLAGRGA